MTGHPTLKGIVLVVLASLCWSLGGLIARSVAADGITIVFFRSLFMMATIALYLGATQGRTALATIRNVGGIGLMSGGLLAASFLFYILSLTHTLVANAYVLMSASPFAAALLARLLLGERLSGATLGCMSAAFLGIVLMVAPDLGGGQGLGNLFAFGVAMAFGANVVLLRKTHGRIDMMPAALLGGLFSALATLPFAGIAAISAHDVALIGLMGVVQLGAGLILFTRGAPLLSAAQSSLLTLTESVAAPVWVWLALSETPGPYTLAGGALVLAAVVAQTLFAARKTP
jgi:drug/metabolite transporter (DMT)-like permease